MTDQNQNNSRNLTNGMIIGGLVAVILAVASYGAFTIFGPGQPKTTTSQPPAVSTSVTPTTAPKTSVVATTPGTPVTDIKWHTPVALTDPMLLSNPSSEDHYYSVGTTKDGEDIVTVEFWDEGPVVVPEIYRFIKKTDGYYFVTHNSSDISQSDPSPIVSGVKSDTTTTFSELEPESAITKQSTKLTYVYNNGITDVTNFSAPKQIGTSKLGNMYMISGASSAPLGQTAIDAVSKTIYYVALADGSKAFYEARPTFIKDDGTFQVSWTNTTGTKSTFSKLRYGGCGLGAGLVPIVGKADYLNGKSEVASTNSSKLYILTDTNNALVKYLYALYKDSRTGSSDQQTIVPIEQYLSKLGFVLWTDDYGNTLVFQNNDYAELAECGKPVIYLYPTKETTVSVTVGAHITKSDPVYNSGWKVTAKPDGSIMTGGHTYPYLFWEGLGFGQYPAIRAGAVVLRANVAATIRSDLTTIGLNEKEIQDFADFWMPRMPSAPFVRLTWLQNGAMNTLAPLTVSPQPDTTIRAFLDFAGLSGPIPIPAQILHHYDRSGFTVVEWGGLLQK